MPGCATAVQQAAAEVRHILLELAAEKLKAPIESLKVEDALGAISGTLRVPSSRPCIPPQRAASAHPAPEAEHQWAAARRVPAPAALLPLSKNSVEFGKALQTARCGGRGA